MSFAKNISFIAVAAVAAFAAVAEEPELSEQPESGRWRVSAGARFAPGVKTRAAVSSSAALDAAGRLGGSMSVRRGSSSSTDQSSESVPVTPTSRFEFEGGFIDMVDDAGIPGQTVNWHFDSVEVFNEAGGTVTISETSTTKASRGKSGTSYSSATASDPCSSHESDIWGGDVEIGYALWRGKRFSLDLGVGTTLYRSDDAIRISGRGGHTSSSSTTVETSSSETETTTFTDPNLSYDGALDDVRNDDGSIGAGTPDGYTNPYGGNNPVLVVGNGSVTRTKTTTTRSDSTTSSLLRTIDVAADGDVEMEELRLALQPAWSAMDWLELRGVFGVAATHVSVDADASVFVNGSRFDTINSDDSEWVFTGLCGIDAVFKPMDWLEVSVGADVRVGDTAVGYDAGIVHGKVELARCTVRACIGIRF